MNKIYLASPLFTEYEREQVRQIAKALRTDNNEVYVPMEHTIKNAWEMNNAEWGKAVFEEDVKAIRDCDQVVCIYYGLYSDSGTAWECGFAYGIGKPVVLYDAAGDEVSLMVVNGAKARPQSIMKKNQT